MEQRGRRKKKRLKCQGGETGIEMWRGKGKWSRIQGIGDERHKAESRGTVALSHRDKNAASLLLLPFHKNRSHMLQIGLITSLPCKGWW